MIYKFKIYNDYLSEEGHFDGVSGNKNVYSCEFDIDCGEGGAVWFAVFKKGDENFITQIIDGKCTFPYECLETAGDIYIGCYAECAENKRISTNWYPLKVKNGAYSRGTAPLPPSEDLWETLLSNSVPVIGENGNWFTYDMQEEGYVDTGFVARGERGIQGEKGTAGYTPQKGVDYFTQEDIEEVAQNVDLSGKQDVLTFDNEPTQGSNNPVTSDGVFNAIDGVNTDLQDTKDRITDIENDITEKTEEAEQVTQELENAISGVNTDLQGTKDRVSAIEGKIPNQASAQNQMADKEFVNSSIARETAHFISNNGQPFTSVVELEAYQGTITNNDYAYVTGQDVDGNTYFDCYKYSSRTNSWGKEFRLNNSSFTAVQWSAITSGITSALVGQITANQQAILELAQALANKVDKATGKGLSTNDFTNQLKEKLENLNKNDIGLGNVDNTSDLDKPVSNPTLETLCPKTEVVSAITNIAHTTSEIALIRNTSGTLSKASSEYVSNMSGSGVSSNSYRLTDVVSTHTATTSKQRLYLRFDLSSYSTKILLSAKLSFNIKNTNANRSKIKIYKADDITGELNNIPVDYASNVEVLEGIAKPENQIDSFTVGSGNNDTPTYITSSGVRITRNISDYIANRINSKYSTATILLEFEAGIDNSSYVAYIAAETTAYATTLSIDSVSSIKITDAISHNIIDYTINGNTDGVGDLVVEGDNDYAEHGGQYRIPIIVRGKNLYNPASNINGFVSQYTGLTNVYNQDHTVLTINCSVVGRSGIFELGTFPAGTYHISMKFLNVNGRLPGICLYNMDTGENMTNYGNSFNVVLNSPTKIGFYTADFTVGNSPYTLSEVQIQQSLTATSYEPYFNHLTNIYLDEPLGEGQSISFADTNVDLRLTEYTNIVEFGTSVQPSSVKIKYYQDINKVIANLQAQ